MNKEYTIKQTAEIVWWYTFTEANAKGETMVVELSKCTNCGGSHALPVLWKQHGYMDRVLETYWSIHTYVKDTEGNSYGRYNPQSKQGKCEIDFDWMFEATEENKQKLIDEAFKMFSEATGETATEIKVKKVKEYAEKYNYEVLTEMPECWIKIESMTTPKGSIRISNMKATLQTIKDKSRKEALLLV
jgi:hypothetical protein